MPSSGMPTSLAALLLAYAAAGRPFQEREAFFLESPPALQDRQFHWLVEGGLGALLHHATREHAQAVPDRWRHALQAAELTARLRYASLRESALEAIDACRALDAEVTLLKGISVSEQLYPQPHLRPMADVDVLLPAHQHQGAILALTGPGAGFERIAASAEPEPYDAPLRHCARGTVVELHKALFPERSPFSASRLFTPADVLASTEASSYGGRPVRRLPAERQLAYIAVCWFNDMTHYRIHPSFLPSLFDAAWLLRRCGSTLDWDGLRERLDHGMVRGCLYALLTYLPRFGATPPPPEFVAWLARTQHAVGALQLRLIHALLDRHLLAARAWAWPFPPPLPGRYSLRHQWEKRWLRTA